MDGHFGKFMMDRWMEIWTIYDGWRNIFGQFRMDGLTFLSLAVQLSILSVTTRLVVILAQTCNKYLYFKTLKKWFLK